MSRMSSEAEKPVVLIVDDSVESLHLLSSFLKEEFRIKLAKSIADALEVLNRSQESPACIVVDMHLGGETGKDLARVLSVSERFSEIPLIFVSADSTEETEAVSFSAGAADFIAKPINGHIAKLRVRSIIQKNIDKIKLKLASHVFSHSGEAIIISDKNNKIIDVNSAFTKMTGYERQEVIGKDPGLLSSGRTSKKEYEEMWAELNATGAWQGEIWDRKKTGEIYPKLMTISTIKDGKNQIQNFIASFVDITPYKEAEKQIRRLAHHDSLTGLPNRLYLHLHLEQALLHAARNQEGVALLFIDLDRFKDINDLQGHARGDALLIAVADRLKHCIRASDFVARLGGDEFVVALKGSDVAQKSAAVAEKIRCSVNKPFDIDQAILHTDTSIGISIFPNDAIDLHGMMRCADVAMYFSKNTGGNCFHYYSPAMTDRAQERIEMEYQLREAIHNEQFELFFQPQYSVDSLEMVGAEALLRWRKNTGELMLPSQFIAIAENTNQIHSIDDWVLEEALRTIEELQLQGIKTPKLAINISAKRLAESELHSSVAHLLQKYNVAPADFEIEITETAVMETSNRVLYSLNQLRDQGVSISLDDFGTGYSSMEKLLDLPLTRLKIDNKFTRSITSDSTKAGAIATATIKLAHSLGYDVVAEGVENEEQLNFLKAAGCDIAQGYYFSRPVDKQTFVSLLQQGPFWKRPE